MICRASIGRAEYADVDITDFVGDRYILGFVFFLLHGVYVPSGKFFSQILLFKASIASAPADSLDLPVEGGVGGSVPGIAGGENGPGEGNGLGGGVA